MSSEVSVPTELFATNTAQMVESQKHLSAWFQAKISQVREELQLARDVVLAMEQTKNRVEPYRRAVKKHEKRLQFFHKCIAAIDLGYTIFPTTWLQPFMVRTDKENPSQSRFTRRTDKPMNYLPKGVETNSPPAGQGQYVNPQPFSSHKLLDSGDEKLKELYQFFNTHHDTNIDFPVSLAQPRVIAELDAAAKELVFDEFCVLQDARDPLLLGRIALPNRPRRRDNYLTFLICWCFDVKTLKNL